MSVTKRDLPEIHVRRETKYGIDPNAGGINYNNVPEEYLLSLSDDSGKLMHGVAFLHLGIISEDSLRAISVLGESVGFSGVYQNCTNVYW